jgi:hypothetical protein
MKANRYVILAALFVALLLVVVAKQVVTAKRESAPTPSSQPLFSMPDSKAVTRLDIVKGSDKTSIYSDKAGTWWIESGGKKYLADKDLVKAALDALVSTKQGEVVSTNKANQAQMQVDKSGTEVIASDAAGKPLADFIIGKTGPSYTTSYVRIQGSDNVYVPSANMQNTFVKDLQVWRNKTVLDVPTDEMVQVKVKRADGIVIQLDKGEKDSWKLSGTLSGPADPQSVQLLLNTLSKLTASSFDDSGKSDSDYGFDKPSYSVYVKTTLTKAYIITAGTTEGGAYYVRRSGDATVYKVGEYLFNNLQKDPKEYLAKTPPKEEAKPPPQTTPPAKPPAGKSGGTKQPTGKGAGAKK